MDRTEQITAVVEKEFGIQLRDDQRLIVNDGGYPLFTLMGMPRRWGKTTVANLWALVHGPEIISMGAERGAWAALRSGHTDKCHIYLPDVPDPDVLFHPIMLHENFTVLRNMSAACMRAGLSVPIIEIKHKDIDFLHVEFTIPKS